MQADSPARKDQENRHKSSHAEREERILRFWEENRIFKKSIDKPAPKGEFTFYDGPPFATGTPHYGHIIAGTMKDVIPRYKTMQGYKVRRRWGWDCHGLPVENLVEKELGLKSKKDIVSYGIDKFNEASRKIVMRYADEWRRIVPRLGRWVDMDDDYRTMDASYTESVWWIFKSLHDKGLIYEGFKSMNLCPHCETTLSNFEVAQGYKDITDISVYVKFELVGEPHTFLVAWTTTPWTLPGNVALAVGSGVEYSKVELPGDKSVYMIAKDRVSAALMGKGHKVTGSVKGSDLVGKKYKPLFDYYAHDKKLKGCENGWKVYAADFVTTVDGTGVVHIAPAFGSDDYSLMEREGLPFVQHVAVDGTFKPEVKDFAGMKVKPKDTEDDKNAHQAADVEIVKWLAHHGLLFEKEKVIHSYPHCWRCETPLLNYAASSWFVKVTDLKDKLVAENRKIRWVPPSVGSARFGNWLEGARDWAISRSRFWGAPIPVWREEGTGAVRVIGSVGDLKRYSRAKNAYYVMRHGEAENNTKGILDSEERDKKHPSHLTEHGKKQVLEAVSALKDVKFDLVFVSPLARTMETEETLKQAHCLKGAKIVVDDRIREFDLGVWNGKDINEFYKECQYMERFEKGPEGGETYADIKKRMGGFLYDLESKYEGKTILVVSHETPIFLLIAAAEGMTRKSALEYRGGKDFIGNAEIRKLDFSPLPHNAEYELDLHRPFIDDLKLETPDGKKLVRVPDVFDCWFESGSMPYGEAHYPFEHPEGFEPRSGLFRRSRGYPADFIAEGLDQTRGWFYSMLVLGMALFRRSPYKNVVVNGLILAEDGQKMAKSKKNYPDPMEVVEKHGADALRHYLMSSQAVRAEELRFSEKGVDEVVKKIVNRLLNVVSFYEMYAPKGGTRETAQASSDILDRWIMSRFGELVSAVTTGLESYELDRATRPIEGFVEDLSTWYLRRSRERFRGEDPADKKAALETTRTVLIGLSKAIAPFMPFLAEEVYQRVSGASPDRSVHLESWPVAGKADPKLSKDMESVRRISSKGLEARMSAKMNVRQPLASLKSNDESLKAMGPGFVDLIKDEVNVKEVVFDPSAGEGAVLDTAVTPELKEEGELRELIRKIQDLRKEKGLTVADKAALVVTEDLKSLVDKHDKEIKKVTNLSGIESGETFSLRSL